MGDFGTCDRTVPVIGQNWCERVFAIVGVRVYASVVFTDRRLEDSASAHSAVVDANPADVRGACDAIDASPADAFGASGCPAVPGDEIAYWAERNRAAGRERAAAAGAVRGAFMDAGCVAEMGLELLAHDDLVDRVVELAAERSRAEARFLAAVGELVARDGARSAAWQLREYTRMSTAHARSETRLAEALADHELGDTFDALAAGDIQTSHARLVAREAPKAHKLDERDLLELCEAYPSDMIARRTLDHRRQCEIDQVQARADSGEMDPADAELAFQRAERRCSLQLGDDGMWHLHADLDYLAGRQVSLQLAAAERAVRRRDDSADDTFAQRSADALCDLISGRQCPGASLVIAADYDLVTGQIANACLDDGTPLSAEQLAELAADAKILPAMFSSDWSQLALGRVRSASEAQKIVLAIRDGGCIACATHSERCHAHHIDHYERGGHTDVANLANLCEPCHTDHHQRRWPIETPPDGRPRRAPSPERPSRAAAADPPSPPPPDDRVGQAPPADCITEPSKARPPRPPEPSESPELPRPSAPSEPPRPSGSPGPSRPPGSSGPTGPSRPTGPSQPPESFGPTGPTRPTRSVSDPHGEPATAA